MSNDKDDSEFDLKLELQNYPVVRDEKKFARLFRLWQKYGNREVYDQLIYGNNRLVLSIAGKYRNRGMDLADLVQEGRLGLMRALETFDPDQSKISTYATLWIRQSIFKALVCKSRTIRIPGAAQGKMTCINRAIGSFYDKHHRQPLDQEVYDEIRALDGTDQETRISRKMKLRDVVYYRPFLSMEEKSLDAPLRPNSGDDRILGEVVTDTNIDTEAEIDLRRLQKMVLERIQCRLKKEKKPQ